MERANQASKALFQSDDRRRHLILKKRIATFGVNGFHPSGDYRVSPNTMGYSSLASASGATPYFGTALGTETQITGSALEQSTADMAGQLTNLMVYQQSYAANSKMFTTNDQMQQDLFALVA